MSAPLSGLELFFKRKTATLQMLAELIAMLVGQRFVAQLTQSLGRKLRRLAIHHLHQRLVVPQSARVGVAVTFDEPLALRNFEREGRVDTGG